MLRQTTIALLLVAGLVMLVMGVTWNMWHSPKSLWTPEQAQEHTEAWRALKAATTSGVRAGDPKNREILAAAQARFNAINSRLEHAKSMNNYGRTYLLIAGAVSLIVAIAAYTSSRGPEEKSTH